MVSHYHLTLPAYGRGFHLITSEILNGIPTLPKSGILHGYIKHTSAGLTINENADVDVRVDFESYMNTIVPENAPFLTHTIEGPDDMPAHVKSSLMGSSVSIPIIDGSLALGTWQGIYLCEFRNRPHRRQIIVSIFE